MATSVSDILETLDYRPTFGIQLDMLQPPPGHPSDLVIKYRLGPGVSGPLEHYHPRITEVFEVESGMLDLKVDGQWQTLSPGHVLAVKPGQKHTFKNATREDTVILTYIEPHGGFAAFFTDLYFLVKARPFKNQWNLLFIAWYAQLEHKHRRDYLTVQPFRAMLRFYGGLAQLLGIRMPKFPETPIVRMRSMAGKGDTVIRRMEGENLEIE
ncbi:MAG: cupin domain-containing protein [Bacteroidetes bacterium]|jgi:Cupin domain|nr:MAG: cupin domain-containing protein [Bacteroidota bacterium]